MSFLQLFRRKAEIMPVDIMAGFRAAGTKYAGVQCCNGQEHTLLLRLAQTCADIQAKACRQGHPDFDKRYQQVRDTLQMSAAEICAESWLEQEHLDAEAMAYEAFKCWRQSPGHWSVASQPHVFWGGGMAKDKHGIWYMTILVAD